MQRVVIVSGTLAVGTALVFGAAALAATLFPNGATVAASWNGWRGGVIVEKGMPVPLPAPVTGPVVVGPDGGVIKGGGWQTTVVDDTGAEVASPEP